MCTFRGNFQGGRLPHTDHGKGPVMAKYPCDHLTACHILHAVKVLGWKQDQAAFYFCVNGGTVSKIVRGLSHYGAAPVPFFSDAAE